MHGHGDKHPLQWPCLAPALKKYSTVFLAFFAALRETLHRKIREFQKNCVSLQTSRRHGVPPCRSVRLPAANVGGTAFRRASTRIGCPKHYCAAGTPHLLYKIHGQFMEIRVRNGRKALPRKANQLFQHGIVMNCPRISQKLLKRNCPCRSVLVRGSYHLPRTFTDRHGLIGRLCKSVLVRGCYHLPRTFTD